MLVEARDEGEKLLLSTRKAIDEKRQKLSADIAQQKKDTLAKAIKSAKEEVSRLQEQEKSDAEKIRKSGKENVSKASKVVLEALMEFASAD